MKKGLTALAVVCFMVTSVFAGGAKETVVINSAADLDGLKIGVVSGYTGEAWCQDNLPNAKLSSFKTGVDAALDLKNGAVDAVVLDELPAQKIVDQNSDLTIVKDNFATEEYSIAVAKGNTELLDTINATINDMKSNGEYEALVNAFMPVDGNIVIPETIPTSGEVLKMGTNAAFAPFEYIEGTKKVGFDITMSENIAQDAGMKLEVIDMAFDSLIGALQAGQIDFIAAGMSVTPERQKNVDFSQPYYSSNQVIIVRK
ncbi:MAG: amino acid ABC transporter substrate-binding protein [Treponema sp. CETP13]|nr:MAG: amino acid ABC transporter substrate-binding protein [Treponema sp. CETP13]